LTLSAVGIVCALATEARYLGPKGGGHQSPATLADGTLLVVSGMGLPAAAGAARTLIDAGATALASFGLAGGLDPALEAGAIFLPSEVISLDGAAIATASHWRQGLSRAIAARHPLAHGRLLSSPRMVASVDDKAALFRDTGAVAVDMESHAIAQVARARELPFIAVRVIVDSAADVLPRAVTTAAAAGHLRAWRLIGALALAPAQLAPLLRLARRYRAASRSLAAVARAGPWAAHAFAVAPDSGRP
jgi:adenosylhomocysteine nucleosidase